MRNLCKQFGDFKAVSDLSLSLNQNQVFALLGHNGAGKTTVINMLTGMLKPTSGEAWINGYSLLNDTEKMRQTIGLC